MNSIDLIRQAASSLEAVTGAPPEPDWHDNAVLLSELATLNKLISRYITSALDADAERGKPVTSAQDAALGQQLVELGQRLLARAHVVSHEPPHRGSG
ncbi:hypothetical protein [Actinophytocola algeriensis]|uniref:Uncharacterized protein n=1 Tax=Actinophytocola algeriensis TaxID=1768010 RepID=A0A7W7QCG8_9PSEU|nr:hypothetical protein [Actinophytocola algeriensis]MBB4910586.1 hypothetical protein [Actinophytocola algeriensis]MBE1480426.1 hypothetical protein [Actinophytocola algeriensis]